MKIYDGKMKNIIMFFMVYIETIKNINIYKNF